MTQSSEKEQITVDPTCTKKAFDIITTNQIRRVEEELTQLEAVVTVFLVSPIPKPVDAGADINLLTRTIWLSLFSLLHLERRAARQPLLNRLFISFSQALVAAKEVDTTIKSLGITKVHRERFKNLVVKSIESRIASIKVLINGGTVDEFNKIGVYELTEEEEQHPIPWS